MKPDWNDVLTLVGLGVTAYGLYLIYAPLAYIVIGLGLIGLGIVRAAYKGAGRGGRKE